MAKQGGGRRGAAVPGRRPRALLFNLFLLKKMDRPYRRTQGGPLCHGPTFGPGVVLLVWIPIRVVKISDTSVSFFDKKTSLN